MGEALFVSGRRSQCEQGRQDTENPGPEEDRTLERAPQRGNGVEERRRAATDLGHIRDGEIARNEADDHRHIRGHR